MLQGSDASWKILDFFVKIMHFLLVLMENKQK